MTAGLRAPLALFLAIAMGAGGCAPRSSAPSGSVHQFTFAWPFRSGTEIAPRGGTTQGASIDLAADPSPEWLALQAPDLTPRERDRRAILAMAGTFRASFDFLEVAGFRAEFAPDRPYQSWGTEIVSVLRDEPRYVSLQHVLVMSIRKKDGSVEGPYVVKHWRQDWRYENRDMLVYEGRNTWARRRLAPAETKAAWTQAVFQVDDSPRYEGAGRWEHFGNVSTWRSGTTWRPLPRREFSVRKDYDVLVGTNRHTITPTGWIQEEENLKVVLDAAGRPAAEQPVLAKELGVNRYERLAGFDRSAGDRYLERTEPFWREVRAAWADVVAHHRRFTLRAAPDQGQLFAPLFAYADALAEGAPFDATDARRVARETVHGYLAPAPTGAAAAY